MIEKLMKNEFFKDISEEELRRIAKNIRYYFKSYKKDEVVAFEGEECNALGLVMEGNIEIQRMYSSGKYIVLKRLSSGEAFGEAIVFSNKNEYPATIIALSDCNIAYIKREDIIQLCLMEEVILKNFVALLSNKIFILNKNLKNSSFKTIRQKVVNFILEQSKIQKSLHIKLKITKEEIASLMGIPRPSLSRELVKMRDEELIQFDRHSIQILKKDELEEELIQ